MRSFEHEEHRRFHTIDKENAAVTETDDEEEFAIANSSKRFHRVLEQANRSRTSNLNWMHHTLEFMQTNRIVLATRNEAVLR